jgi:uncharacterized phage-associated protein
MTQFKASEIAHYIVHAFQDAGDLITSLKLQKLLYYCQGWHLGINGVPLFEEDFEAWVHGPVIPEIYHGYSSNYRWNPILEPADKTAVDQVSDSESTKEHLQEVLEVFGGETGYQLELMTHRERPWIQARGGIAPDELSNEIIKKEWMKSYFAERASASE